MACSPPESKRGSQRQSASAPGTLTVRRCGRGVQAPDSHSPKPLCLVLYGLGGIRESRAWSHV